MRTVLVAGGAGFIGSHLCERLLANGCCVFCVDNLITGDKQNIVNFSDNPNFKFISSDVSSNLSTLSETFQDKELTHIFHLASPASPNNKSKRSYINHPIETLMVNSYGTYNLLELASVKNSAFLYASSSEIYGDPFVSPQNEDYFGNVNPNGVRSVYDEGKRFGEAITMAYFRKYQLDVRIIRIFNTYGPKMQKDDGRVVSNFITQALENKAITIYGEGKQTRSFCYVDDMVDGLISAMFESKSKGEVLNLGNPNEMTVLDLAKMVKEMTNSNSEIKFEKLPQDDPKRRCPDISKASRLLKWSPKIELSEGLKKTIEYFQKI